MVDGDIYVESTVGVGSAFHVSFPVVVLDDEILDVDDIASGPAEVANGYDSGMQPAAMVPDVQEIKENLQKQAETSALTQRVKKSDAPTTGSLTSTTTKKGLLADKCVWVVDDNMLNCKVAQAQLKPHCANVEVFLDGKSCVDRLRDAGNNDNHNPDLILMDWSMPDMDGLATTRLVRLVEQQQSRRPSIVLALTAHRSIDLDESQATNAGMDGILEKPLRWHDLELAIADRLTPSV